jgi:hypothetical protein
VAVFHDKLHELKFSCVGGNAIFFDEAYLSSCQLINSVECPAGANRNPVIRGQCRLGGG